MAKKVAKKVAKKKTAAKKKKAAIAVLGQSELNIRTVKYQCDGGNCSAIPRSRHLNRGDLVILFATNTGVTIRFTNGSPFLSGTAQIQLAQGAFDLQIVDPTIQSGTTFDYDLTCTKPLCANLENPPEMIVD